MATPSSDWTEFHPLRIAEKARECEGVHSFVLESPGGSPLPAFLPGQYLPLALAIPGEDRPRIRCYSLCDPPSSGTYRIAVKALAAPAGRDVGPGVASTWLNDYAQVGSLVQARGPTGRFTLDVGATGPVVLLAAGIGITPLLSMFEECLARGTRPVKLFLGVRGLGEHPFKARLEAAGSNDRAELQVCYSRPEPEAVLGRDYHHTGRVTTGLIEQALPPADEPYTFYMCGPPAFMESLSTGLRGLGVPESQIRVEAFGRPTVRSLSRSRLKAGLAEPSVTGAPVTFARSGKTAAWDPKAESLLEFAAANDVWISYACAAGHCGTCATALLDGEVGYSVEPQFPLHPGRCLPCVTVPKGPCTLDA